MLHVTSMTRVLSDQSVTAVKGRTGESNENDRKWMGTAVPWHSLSLWGHYQKIIKSNKGQLLTSCSHTFFGKQVRTYLGLKAVHLLPPPKDLLSSYYVPNSGHILLKATVPLVTLRIWEGVGPLTCNHSGYHPHSGSVPSDMLSPLHWCCPPTRKPHTRIWEGIHTRDAFFVLLFFISQTSNITSMAKFVSNFLSSDVSVTPLCSRISCLCIYESIYHNV